MITSIKAKEFSTPFVNNRKYLKQYQPNKNDIKYQSNVNLFYIISYIAYYKNSIISLLG